MKTYAEYRKQVEETLSGQLRSLGEIPDILLKAMSIRCWRAASGFARCCCWHHAKPSAVIRERRCRLPVHWK